MKSNRYAFTLLELSIGIFLFSLILIGVLNLFSSGMKGSTKALTHQDNMEAANILMSQIEDDLARTYYIDEPKPNESDKHEAKLKGNFGSVTYGYNGSLGEYSADGISRTKQKDGGESSEHNYAKGHPVRLNFTHYVSDPTENVNRIEKHAMWVELEIGSPRGDVASFSINKLIYLRKPY